MRVFVDVRPDSLLSMEPSELADFLHNEVVFDVADDMDSDDGRKRNMMVLNTATAYAAYFTEMELKAKTQKRLLKLRNKEDKDGIDKMLAIEETFKAYKEFSKLYIDNISKMMTMKRLELDEAKAIGLIP